MTAAHFKPISAVYGLDVEDIAGGEAEDSLHRGCHVFVHPIRKLDHHNRPFAGCTNKRAGDRARPFSELSKSDFHSIDLSIGGTRVYRAEPSECAKNQMFFRSLTPFVPRAPTVWATTHFAPKREWNEEFQRVGESLP